MLGSIRNALGSLKEKSAEVSATAYLNQQIKSFGAVKRLEIDSTAKTALIEVELKGEHDPIWVRVDSFELLQEAGKALISIRQVSASREWIGLALQQFVVGRKFDLPSQVAWVLRG